MTRARCVPPPARTRARRPGGLPPRISPRARAASRSGWTFPSAGRASPGCHARRVHAAPLRARARAHIECHPSCGASSPDPLPRATAPQNVPGRAPAAGDARPRPGAATVFMLPAAAAATPVRQPARQVRARPARPSACLLCCALRAMRCAMGAGGCVRACVRARAVRACVRACVTRCALGGARVRDVALLRCAVCAALCCPQATPAEGASATRSAPPSESVSLQLCPSVSLPRCRCCAAAAL